MRKLKRRPKPGRAAVVVPNGTLFRRRRMRADQGGAAQGVQPAHDRPSPERRLRPLHEHPHEHPLLRPLRARRKEVWYYEHPLPTHRAHLKGKSYSATDALEYEEFIPLLEWWKNRRPTEQAWQVDIGFLRENGFDLAQTHPKARQSLLPSPADIITTVRRMKDDSEEILRDLEQNLSDLTKVVAPDVRLEDLLLGVNHFIKINDRNEYTRPRVQLHFRGARVRDCVLGSQIGSKSQTIMGTNDLVISRIDARNGAMALVPSELDGAIATNDFPVFEIRSDRVLPAYLRYCLFQPSMLRVYENMSRGSTNRRRLSVHRFLGLTIAIPSDLDVQLQVADALRKAEEGIGKLHEQFGGMDEELERLNWLSACHYVFRKH